MEAGQSSVTSWMPNRKMLASRQSFENTHQTQSEAVDGRSARGSQATPVEGLAAGPLPRLLAVKPVKWQA